jgi:hypothetical protein
MADRDRRKFFCIQDVENAALAKRAGICAASNQRQTSEPCSDGDIIVTEWQPRPVQQRQPLEVLRQIFDSRFPVLDS